MHSQTMLEINYSMLIFSCIAVNIVVTQNSNPYIVSLLTCRQRNKDEYNIWTHATVNFRCWSKRSLGEALGCELALTHVASVWVTSEYLFQQPRSVLCRDSVCPHIRGCLKIHDKKRKKQPTSNRLKEDKEGSGELWFLSRQPELSCIKGSGH